MRKLISFFLFFLLVSLASGMDLTVSPEEIVFNGMAGEVICENLSIEVDGFNIVLVEDRWAEVGFMERKLTKHRIESKELGLEIDYVDRFVVGGNDVFEVCLEGEKAGDFHGVLLFRGEGVSAGVGVWMVVSLEKGEGVASGLGSRVGSITGNVIGAVRSGGFGIVLVLFLIFIVVLEVLLLVWRRKVVK